MKHIKEFFKSWELRLITVYTLVVIGFIMTVLGWYTVTIDLGSPVVDLFVYSLGWLTIAVLWGGIFICMTQVLDTYRDTEE